MPISFADAHLILNAVKIAHAVKPSDTTSRALDAALKLELEAATRTGATYRQIRGDRA